MLRVRQLMSLLILSLALFSSVALAQTVEAPTVSAPHKLAIGTNGTLEVGLLLQTWLVYDHMDDANASSFRLRRSEISFKGDLIPKRFAYKVMIDPSRVLEFQNKTIAVSGDASKLETVTVSQPASNTVPTSSSTSAVSALQDVALTFLSEYADVSIGQFKTPVSWEGFNSSGKLLFAERAEVARRYGDKRDLGIQATKTFSTFGYTVGVFNGSGSNNLDANNSKDVALRLEAYPIKGLTLAGVGYMSVGDRKQPGTKDRYEADVRYQSGSLLLQGEYIRARDVGKSEAVTNAHGVYGAAAWMIDEHIQPCVRVSFLDPNLDKEKDDQMNYDIGLNYYAQSHEVKFQANYGIISRPDVSLEHMGTLAVQYFF